MNWFSGHVPPSRATVDPCCGSPEGRKKRKGYGVWLLGSSLLLESKLPSENCQGSSETQTLLPHPLRVVLSTAAPGPGCTGHAVATRLTQPLSRLTSGFSKQVTVMRMLSKSVQLHRSTYIPSSLPSCRNLLMAYSVLEGERQREKALTNRSTLNPRGNPARAASSLTALLRCRSWVLSDQTHEARRAEEP